MGIFNLQLFKRKDPSHPPGTLQKEEWMEEAMPLFPVATVVDRVQSYQIGLGALSHSEHTRSHDMQQMFPDVVNVTEHRYVLDAAQIGDPAYLTAAKKAYAMASGRVRFLTAAKLHGDGWDTNSIVGTIPDAGLGALQLFIPESFRKYWNYYYPQMSRFELTDVFYFNIALDTLDGAIKPLIEKYVSEKQALDELNSSTIVQTGDWVADYFQLFLEGALFIPVSGGDVIADLADDDRLNPDSRHYRLSVFYLKGPHVYDNVTAIDELFSYRQRLPSINDMATALLESKSLAGHPLISARTLRPVDTARVDLVDQDAYGRKMQSNLELDPDAVPQTLRLQKAPSPSQLQSAQSQGIDLSGHGTAYFTLYNPDGQTLTISDTSNGLAFSQTAVSAGEWQALIGVSASGPVPDPTLVQIHRGSDLIQELLAKVFDFRLLPVSFWYLDPLGPGDLDFDAMFDELNRILGRQANVFVYPAASIGQDPRAQTIQIPGVHNPNQSIAVTDSFIYDAPGHLENAEATEHDINVILTWKLHQPPNGTVEEIKLNGATTRIGSTDPRPIIFADITTHDAARVAGTIAHEIGHFFAQQFRREAAISGVDLTEDIEEFHHGVNGAIDRGSSSFIYNLMYYGRPPVNLLLTTRQAELINAGAVNVI
jgi:hypothetical protein